MAGNVSIRKSARVSKVKLEEAGENTTMQSRITEYVNVRKRGTATLDAKKHVSVFERESESSLKELVGTPVKIKRKQVKSVSASVGKMGLLTPSPSVESINDKSEPEPEEEINSAVVTDAPIIMAKISDEAVALQSEVKSVSSPVPAYKRFAHLVEGVRSQKVKLSAELEVPVEFIKSVDSNSVFSDFKYVPWLPLNEKWSFYEKLIFNVDTLCVLATGRSQPCVFHKIQKTLENVLGKQVPIEQLERLKTLWPESYECRDSRVIMQGKRVDSVALNVPGIVDVDSSAALLNERKDRVRGRVQKYLIEAHAREFDFPQTEIPKQWHQKFDQNKVAEIPRTPLKTLLSLPVVDTPKFINDIIISSPMKSEKDDTIDKNDEGVVNNADNTPIKKSVSTETVKLTLLERIRAKEQALQIKKCFFSNDNDDRINAIISQMDRFTQSVMFTFTSSKKTSLFLTDLTAKLVQSSSVPLSPAEVLERLKMLEKCAPNWIKICDDSSCDGPKYVKILDKTRTLNSILDSLHAKYIL